MPQLTAEQAYMADLAEIERLDAVSWISGGAGRHVPGPGGGSARNGLV
jgi:hypothetical protein